MSAALPPCAVVTGGSAGIGRAICETLLAEGRRVTTLERRLVFDLAAGEVRDAERRYLLMRPDVLMGAFARLDAQGRARALQAFADSAAEHGANSVRAYLAESGAPSDRLLEIIRTSAAALGWGRWVFEAAPGSLRLTVHNSPFAAGFGHSALPVCAPIAGMLSSVAEHALHGPVAVSETDCAAHGEAACRFVATRR